VVGRIAAPDHPLRLLPPHRPRANARACCPCPLPLLQHLAGRVGDRTSIMFVAVGSIPSSSGYPPLTALLQLSSTRPCGPHPRKISLARQTRQHVTK
jgi:hypothetical protein